MCIAISAFAMRTIMSVEIGIDVTSESSAAKGHNTKVQLPARTKWREYAKYNRCETEMPKLTRGRPVNCALSDRFWWSNEMPCRTTLTFFLLAQATFE